MTRSRAVLYSLAALVALAALLVPPPGTADAARGTNLFVRLFGPISGVAANVQWARADLAFRRGRIEAFHARARTALLLAPDSVEGWKFLARHQGWTLASPEREPDPAARLAWVRAGLATAAEGERHVSRPGELAQTAGEILVTAALLEPPLSWPGGRAALWERAAEEFERAGRLGVDAAWAAALAASARAAAHSAR